MATEKMLLYTRVAAPKAPKKRSRAGCNFCKDKKKKCDEARPTCSRCQEHGEECHYEPVKPRQRRRTEIADKSTPNTDCCRPSEEIVDILPAETTLEPQLALTKRLNHHEEDDLMRWDSVANLSTHRGYDTFPSFSSDPASQLKKGDPFLYEGLGIASNSNHNPSLDFVAPSASPSPLFEFRAPAFEEFSNDFHHRLLMNHFCNTLSHLIVLREDDGNPFQQLVLPLAYNTSWSSQTRLLGGGLGVGEGDI